jgi:hypothetical protein
MMLLAVESRPKNFMVVYSRARASAKKALTAAPDSV